LRKIIVLTVYIAMLVALGIGIGTGATWAYRVATKKPCKSCEEGARGTVHSTTGFTERGRS
jgi:hypothetical protein